MGFNSGFKGLNTEDGIGGACGTYVEEQQCVKVFIYLFFFFEEGGWKPEGKWPLSKPRGGCDITIYVDF